MQVAIGRGPVTGQEQDEVGDLLGAGKAPRDRLARSMLRNGLGAAAGGARDGRGDPVVAQPQGQELQASGGLYEGAATVTGRYRGKPVTGLAYAEQYGS